MVRQNSLSLIRMDFSFFRILGFWGAVAFMNFSCTKGEVSVSTFGKNIPAPSLLNTKTVKGNGCEISYVEMEGSCHLTVNAFEVSMDEIKWIKVPSEMSLYDNSGKLLNALAVSQDTTCTNDGHFSFALSSSWLAQSFGISKDKISKVYIRGSNEGMKSVSVSSNSLAAVPGNNCNTANTGGVLRGKIYSLTGRFSSGIGSGGSQGSLAGSTYKVKNSVSTISGNVYKSTSKSSPIVR